MDRFEKLDSFRGIGALSIAILHYAYFMGPSVHGALSNLYLMVDFFFVLSGLIIAKAYLHRLGCVAQVRMFLVLRLARLYPLVLVVLLGFAALELTRVMAAHVAGITVTGGAFGDLSMSGRELLLQLLLANGLGFSEGPAWNYPSWSISTEAVTYLVFAIICCLLGGMRIVQRRAFWMGLAMLSWITLVAFAPDMNQYGSLAILRCFTGFFTGVALFLTISAPSQSDEAQWRGGKATVIEGCAVLASVVFLCTASAEVSFLAPFGLAGFVWVFLKSDGAVSWVLRLRALRGLGRLSYGIYMIHALLLFPLAVLGRQVSPMMLETITLWGLPVYLGCLIVLAGVSFRFVETPARAAARDWMTGPRARAAGEAPYPRASGRSI